MNPTPAAITKIRAYAAALSGGWTGNSDAQILAAYNAATLDNPATQEQVPVVLAESSLKTLLGAGSLANLMLWGNFGLLKADIDSNNKVAVGELWAPLLAETTLPGGSTTIIQPSEAAAITAFCQSEIADPAWQAKVSQAQIDLGRAADAADIAAARTAQ